MKKAISFLLALAITISMCLNFSACSSNTTKLTLDNYKKYLKFTSDAYATQTEDSSSACYYYKYGIDVGDTVVTYFNNGYGLLAKVEGASTNFNYNDVVITVRFSGTYGILDPDNRSWVDYDMEEIYTFECDISGAGSSWEIISVEDMPPVGQTCTEILNIECEIIDIAGTVSAAN